MKRYCLSLIVCTLMFCSCCEAQMGTMKWHFRSRADVIPALKQTRGNLRKTYEVIVCAARQGYSNTALGYYEGINKGQDFDASAQDSAAYAFAYYTCDGLVPWDWKKDTDYSSISVKESSAARIQIFADRAKRMGVGSPEVMIMLAFPLGTGVAQERKMAYSLASRAAKRAPNWADALYWQGLYANLYGYAFKGKGADSEAKRVALAHLAMRSYDQAEKLDPGLRPRQYKLRADACEVIADKKCAQMIPTYIDAYIRTMPGLIPYMQSRYNESEAKFRQDWMQTADDIAKKATS